MSHFSVLVIGANPEEQLEPFNENLEIEFNDITIKCEQEYKTGTIDVVLFDDGSCYHSTAPEIDKYWQRKHKHFRSAEDKLVLPDNAQLVKMPLNQFFPTFDKYMNCWYGQGKNEDGRYGYWYNPQAKWDWYQLGGGWAKELPLKNGEYTESAKWGDIDLSKFLIPFAILKDGVWYEKGKMGWWAVVENEKSDADWNKEVQSIIADISPDTEVNIYDCHI